MSLSTWVRDTWNSTFESIGNILGTSKEGAMSGFILLLVIAASVLSYRSGILESDMVMGLFAFALTVLVGLGAYVQYSMAPSEEV